MVHSEWLRAVQFYQTTCSASAKERIKCQGKKYSYVASSKTKDVLHKVLTVENLQVVLPFKRVY